MAGRRRGQILEQVFYYTREPAAGANALVPEVIDTLAGNCLPWAPDTPRRCRETLAVQWAEGLL